MEILISLIIVVVVGFLTYRLAKDIFDFLM